MEKLLVNNYNIKNLRVTYLNRFVVVGVYSEFYKKVCEISKVRSGNY